MKDESSILGVSEQFPHSTHRSTSNIMCAPVQVEAWTVLGSNTMSKAIRTGVKNRAFRLKMLHPLVVKIIIITDFNFLEIIKGFIGTHMLYKCFCIAFWTVMLKRNSRERVFFTNTNHL
jgi:hypothetical protein